MQSTIFWKIGAGILGSWLISASIITQLDPFNKNQYKDIYIYASNDSSFIPPAVALPAPPAVVPPQPNPQDPQKPEEIETKQIDFKCRLKGTTNEFKCSLKKSNIVFEKNQTTQNKIINSIIEDRIDEKKDFGTINTVFRIFVAGSMTGFKNVDQKIELIWPDNNIEFTILFSTDKHKHKTISKISYFLGNQTSFSSGNELAKDTNYQCKFDETKETEYQNCKIFDFDDSKNEFAKYSNNTATESSTIVANKKYVINFDHKDTYSQNKSKLFIKNTAGAKATIVFEAFVYNGSDKVILLDKI